MDVRTALVGVVAFGVSAMGCSTGSESAPLGKTGETLVNDGEQKVVMPVPEQNARFANAVALSANLAVVGSRAARSSQGAAYLFERSGRAWVFRQELSAGSGGFGTTVAISGFRIAIAAPNASIPFRPFVGAVYVFEHDGRTATLRQVLSPASAVEAGSYGRSLALDGDTLLVGDARSVHVLEASGGTFTETQVLAGAANSELFSVALRGDTLIRGVSEPGPTFSDPPVAVADVFVRSGPGAPWQLQQRLAATDGHAYDRFGYSVALDGNTALVGSSDTTDTFGRFGAARVFARSGSVWTQEKTLEPSDRSSGDAFGTSVSLAGNLAIVGAPFDDDDASDQGSAYMFGRSGSEWTQLRKLVASDPGDRDYLGTVVSITDDFALVGAPNDDLPLVAQGSAYFFRLESLDFPPGEVCVAGCLNDFRCPTGDYCEASGLCLPQKLRGRACEQADCRKPGCSVCATGFCVDGFCCEQSCTGDGLACASLLTGQPNGTCAATLGSGGSGGGGAGAGAAGASSGGGGSGGAGSGGTGGAGPGGSPGAGGTSGGGTGGTGGAPIQCVRVSPDGDDVLAASTLGATPFQNVQPAIDFADAHRDIATSVCLAAGPACGAEAQFFAPDGSDYSMRNGISVFGRYESSTWTRCSDSITALLARQPYAVTFGPDVTTATELNGVLVHALASPAVAGVAVDGASGVKLAEVEAGGVAIEANSEVTIERSRVSGGGVSLKRSRLLLTDSDVLPHFVAGVPLQVQDPRDVHVLRSTLSSSELFASFALAVDVLGEVGSFVIEDSVIEAHAPGGTAIGISSVATNATGVELRRNQVRVSGRANLTGMFLIGGGAVVDSNDVELESSGIGQAVGVQCDGFAEAASCREIAGNSVSLPSCSGSCAYDSTALVVAGMGTLVDSNVVGGGCSSGASWTSAVGLRAAGDLRVQNNVITGAECDADGAVRGIGVLVDSQSGLVDLHSNYVDGGATTASGCFTAGIQLEAGSALVRNNIIVPGSCATSSNVHQSDGALFPVGLTNNDFAPGVVTAGLYSIAGAIDPRTIAEVNALLGASGNFSAECPYPLVAGAECVDAGTLDQAPPVDIDGELREDGAPDVGPDELVDADPCAPNPCQNGASCVPANGTAACACVDGFLGATCNYRLSAIDSGYFGNCGLRTSDGSAECWGATGNSLPPTGSFLDLAVSYGQTCGVRGNASTDSAGPLECWGQADTISTPPAGAFRAIDSLVFSCGIRDDGTLVCWGSDNANGELDSPVGAFAAVAVGRAHACALGASGIVCWGANTLGQASPPAGPFAAVSSGMDFSCGLRPDETVACWGSNDAGQTDSPSGAFVALSAGERHACALRTDGTLACWGVDFDGQATPPSGTFSLSASLSAGGRHTCIADELRGVLCWGSKERGRSNPRGGLFRAVSTENSQGCAVTLQGVLMCWYEEDIEQIGPPPGGTFIDVSMGATRGCAIRTDGTLMCWGTIGSDPFTLPNGSFLSVATGGAHACARRPDEAVACWGSNFEGQASPPPGAFAMIGAADNHTCGLRHDGSAACWGGNDFGETAVPAGTYRSISTTFDRSCGVRSDGTLLCWGTLANRGVMPTGTFDAVSVGLQHACAIRTDGSLSCWGPDFLAHLLVPPPGPFLRVDVGSAGETCAVRPNLLLECFGSVVY